MSDNSAPGRLELVRTFINTLDLEQGGRPHEVDAVADRSAVASWLTDNGLLAASAEPTDEELDRARDAREALRNLAYVNNGDHELDPRAIAVLNQTGDRAPVTVAFDDAGRAAMAARATGVDGALGELLAIVAESMTEGTWSRLKACAKDTCRWAFYDNARNRSGRWCSMASCGNRAKAATYRAKQQSST